MSLATLVVTGELGATSFPSDAATSFRSCQNCFADSKLTGIRVFPPPIVPQ